MQIWHSEQGMPIKFKKYSFRDAMPCCVIKMYQSLGANCLHLQCRNSEDGSRWFLEAEVKLPAYFTAAQNRGLWANVS